MKIVVDCREHDFIETCREKISQYPHITLETRQLDLGDVEFHHEDKILLVWERKTLNDMLQSIKDGRYAEQSHRLLNVYSPKQVVYLIEGIFSQIKTENEKKMITSAMTTLSFFKGVHLWRSVHVHDSVDQLLASCDKIYREYEKGNEFEKVNTQPVPYSQFVKKEKKGNVTPDNIGEIFLCQIPGINTNTAQAFMLKVNGDFQQLINMAKENPKELYNTYMGKEKPRRISKTAVEQLCIFLGNKK